MAEVADDEPRWAHLLNAALHLEESKNVSVALDSVLEAFDSHADPVDDLRGYAVRRFALALKETLTAPR